MSGDGGDPGLSIVPEDVTALGKYAYDLAETLRSALTDAGHEVDALTGKNWSGAAATSFAEGWAETSDGGSKIIEALTTMASALGITAKTYVAQDNQFAGEVSSLDLP
ncbi:WXG100 family type VII secretion target [Nocardia vaccinii]|uniref:WXG100 family type VII secretion target n=1 Tax=Nocardia vaccinii TaxID=1822 RepID=UPI000836E443|nr:WXG100 family type VII secretion target [Nocardia vaccinii]